MRNYPDIDERIEYLKSNSIIFDGSRAEDSLVNIVSSACDRAGFEVREDNFHRAPEAAKVSVRLGLSVYSEKRDPLIYLIPSNNKTNIELVDTILHEALHATGKPLGRHVQPPEDTSSIEYYLEELCVHSGLKYLYPIMKRPEMRSISRRNREAHGNLMKSLGGKVSKDTLRLWNEHGEKAALYFLKYISAIQDEREKPSGHSS